MSTRNWTEIAFITAMVFWPHALLLLGLLTLRSRQRVVRGLVGLALLLPSTYKMLDVWQNWAGIDAKLFWMVPLTANVAVAALHLLWLFRHRTR